MGKEEIFVEFVEIRNILKRRQTLKQDWLRPAAASIFSYVAVE